MFFYLQPLDLVDVHLTSRARKLQGGINLSVPCHRYTVVLFLSTIVAESRSCLLKLSVYVALSYSLR